MSDIRISGRAYAKILLHAAKYPHCAVNGILLAKGTGKDKNTKQIDFVDVIPLFHICLNVSPMAEIALTQIDGWASREGLTIAGYYTASDNLRENTIEKSNHRIADKIAENYSQACLVIIDNLKLSPHAPSKELPMRVAQQNSDGKWRPVDRVQIQPSGADLAVLEMIRMHCQNDLVDFDNHLDDLKLDWRNSEINEEFVAFMKSYKD